MGTLALAGIGLGFFAGVALAAAYAALVVGGETDELTEYYGWFWVGEDRWGGDGSVQPEFGSNGSGTASSWLAR